jgi:hypothetical protein
LTEFVFSGSGNLRRNPKISPILRTFESSDMEKLRRKIFIHIQATYKQQHMKKQAKILKALDVGSVRHWFFVEGDGTVWLSLTPISHLFSAGLKDRPSDLVTHHLEKSKVCKLLERLTVL